MQHEVDKKWKAAQHIYDADIPQNMPVWNLFGSQVLRSNKVLFWCGSQ